MNELFAEIPKYIEHSPLIALAIAFAGGLITSLTPCVYPMIPITASYIGGRSAGQSKLRSFILSLSYVLGLAAVYSGLGAFSALTGGLFGKWVANPWVNIAFANIFIILGLSMMDAFMLPLPKFLTGINPQKKGAGALGAFTVGAASAFVAAPCTAPVLLAILAYVTRTRDIVYGTSLLFSYSLGMGLLLIVVGTFAGVLAAMPKSGAWMVRVKHAFGWLMIFVAQYYLIQAGKGMF